MNKHKIQEQFCWEAGTVLAAEQEAAYENTQGGIECIDCIKAAMTEDGYKGYLKGNAIKYLYRAGRKDSELQDYRKAEWYVLRLVELAREAEIGE